MVQSATCAMTYEITLPGGQKVKQKSLCSELPQCPLLVNPNKIKAYTRLYAMDEANPRSNAK